MIIDLPRGWPTSDNFAPPSTAQWTDPQQVARGLPYEEGKLFIGTIGKKTIGIRDDRHALTVAASRAGKGISVLIPNLCLYPGSMVVIDPKGELATITAARRGSGSQYCQGMGQDIHVLDPFEVSRNSAPQYHSSYNPLDIIDLNDESAIDEADLIAESLIYAGPGDRDSHWIDAGRNLLKALILFTVAAYRDRPKQKTLPEVRRILSSKSLFNTLETMEKQSGKGAIGDVMAQEATTALDMGDKERGAVYSTIRTQTKFLTSPAMQRVLGSSKFDFTTLKQSPSTVYLCLPAMRMGTHNRWLRLMINQALSAMERVPQKPIGGDVIFLMDEFPVLGRMESIQTAIGQIAGVGVKLWLVIQDLSQLQRNYADGWETFFSNSGIVQYFGNTDLQTTEYISRSLGQIVLETASIGDVTLADRIRGATGITTTQQSFPLLHPDEIARNFARRHNNQLLMLAGREPVQIERINYFGHDLFSGLYEPDPAYS